MFTCFKRATGVAALEGMIAFSSKDSNAKRPIGGEMIENLDKLPAEVHFIYGTDSWIPMKIANEIETAIREENRKMCAKELKSCSVSLVTGHHQFQLTEFIQTNTIINRILAESEQRKYNRKGSLFFI